MKMKAQTGGEERGCAKADGGRQTVVAGQGG